MYISSHVVYSYMCSVYVSHEGTGERKSERKHIRFIYGRVYNVKNFFFFFCNK